jgi:hypothetical protein
LSVLKLVSLYLSDARNNGRKPIIKAVA